jgi:hypothetical protein
MRFSINLPNFGYFADARRVAKLGEAVEQAGWDGLFVWDHVVERTSTEALGRRPIRSCSPSASTRDWPCCDALTEGGATWWDERQLQSSPDLYQLAPVLTRIEPGPPAL